MTRRSWIEDDQGTALMEFALVMPILVFLIFCTIQLALVCMARQVVHYAAYAAARATLVYHPNDFGIQNGDSFSFYEDRGVAHQAACQALCWIGQLPGGGDKIVLPDWGEVPGSGWIRQQVTIDSQNSAILVAAQAGGLREEALPAVKVTVKFHYPLLIPFAGTIIAYFAGGGKGGENWNTVGLLPRDMPETLDKYYQKNGGATLREKTGLPFLTLQESCLLPRLWDTATFPRAEQIAALGTEDLP